MSNKLKQAERAVKLIGRSMDGSSAVLRGRAQITLFGNTEALVDGCKGVLEYGENTIKLNIGKGAVIFVGQSLELRSLNNDQAVVIGSIGSVEFA